MNLFNSFNWQVALVSLILAFAIFLAVVVLKKGPKVRTNRLFLAFSLSVITLIGSAFLSDFFPRSNPSLAIVFSKITISGVPLMTTFLYLFSRSFPRERKKNKILEYFLYIFVTLLVITALFTPYFVKGIELTDWGFNVVNGPLFNIIVLPYALVLMIVSLINFALSYFKTKKKIEKIQIRFLFYGFLLFISLEIFFNVILPAVTSSQEYYIYGNYSFIIFLVFVAYAITKHSLFNIRVIATEFAVAIVSLALFVEIFISKSILETVIKAILWIIATYGGFILVRSVKLEIKRRKQIEKLAERLRIANVKLKEVDRLKSEFLSMASHQLRTPLSIIKGYLHTLKAGKVGEITEKQEHFVETAMEANDQLIAIIDDFLNLGRIEENRIKVEFEKVDLREVIGTVIERMGSLAIKKEITINFEKPDEFVEIEADKAKLVEVITNLVDNSIKYGKEKGMVRLELKDMEDEVAIVEEDDGIGIPDSFKSRLFKKFNRAHNAVKAMPSGNGIGLYLVKKIVNLHHGKVFMESREGEGTKFTIILPIKQKRRGDGGKNEKSIDR